VFNFAQGAIGMVSGLRVMGEFRSDIGMPSHIGILLTVLVGPPPSSRRAIERGIIAVPHR